MRFLPALCRRLLSATPALQGLLVPLLIVAGLWFMGSPSWADFSMLDLATQFEEGLSRPLIPDISLWLPFWLQVVISVVSLVVMGIVFTAGQKNRPLVMLVVIAMMVRYLLWRTFETLTFKTPESTIVGYIIYGAELLSFVTLLLGYFQMVGLTNRKAQPLGENDAQPSVDVFLCTYNEPINVIYRSLVGCQAIDYANKTVYLLDDGNRSEMAELAEKLGVKYIARTDNKHAKAGNMNHALPLTNGELIAIFDADHVPARRFINDIVGYFKNPKMAFVQTPQHFFTPDPFQRNLVSEDVMNNEQDLYFHIIEPGNDYWNCTIFAGSGALFRRQALEEIGGFAVETITEDAHTGLRLHAKGWDSAYYNKDLSAGMAQDSFGDFVKQRVRWGRGMAQILFFDNPFLVGGLSLAQRLCYFAAIWFFFFGALRLIFLLVPLTYLYFGMKPIDAGFVEIFTFFGPAFIASTFGYTVLTHGLRHTFWAEVYETATCVYMLQTNILTLLFPWRAKFNVTPKEGMNDGMSFNWVIVFPQIVIGFLIAFGLGFAVVRAIADQTALGGIITNVFWSLYNLALIVGAVYVAQERPQFRLSPRIYRQVRCELRLLDDTIAVGYTTNLSESGIAVVFDQPIPISGTLSLKLLDWDLDELSVYQVQAVRSSRDDNGRFYVGFRVVNRTDEQHQSLIRHMFSDATVWRKYHRESTTGKSFYSWLGTPFRMANTKETPARRRTLRVRQNLPCAIVVGNDRIQGFSDQVSETGVAVVVRDGAQHLELGQTVQVMIDWSQQEGAQENQAQVLRAEIKRRVNLGGGQTLFGMNFIDLTKEERLGVIQNLYQDAEDVVRVAPVIAMQVPTQLVTTGGQHLDAVTQEVSEMGAVLRVRGNGQVLRLGDTVNATFNWPQSSLNGGQQTTYQAVVKDIAEAPDGTPGLILVYFKNLDLRALDVLSRCLHQPAA